ncbi:WXG100 family type VII secretion target [Actinomadura sp. 3N407]|uniref:WXG100 family type VII secretion target n=1 Tax=Actinomadura sp. 3N407 TaxID=3457423 RepID=UPI003FCD9D4E
MISFEFRLAKGKPQSLEKAAADWSKAAKELEQAANDLRSLAQGIPEQAWNMDDRKGYEAKVEGFCQSVEALNMYLQAVSIALNVLAYALLAYAIFAMGMAVYIDVLLVLAVAALASVVGAPSYGAIVAAAGTGLTITHIATAILASAGSMAGMAMFGGAGLTTASQTGDGLEGAGGAFKEAVVNGAAGSAANLLQNAANAGLSWVNRSDGSTVNGGLPGGGSSGSKGFPVSEIDLDADRSIDETWTYGGGVKFNTPAGETEIAGNVKKNEEGWAGGEVGVNQKVSDPTNTWNATGGGKVTWDENEDVGGGFKAGGGHSPSGSKAEYEGGWNGQGDYSDKYNVNTPGFNREGSFDKAKDETPPWDK